MPGPDLPGWQDLGSRVARARGPGMPGPWVLGCQVPALIFYFAVGYWTVYVCWSFNTAYSRDGVLIKERRKIATHYARTWLPFDQAPQPLPCGHN